MHRAHVSANSELLSALKAARLAVLSKISTGQAITEYSDGVVRIRKESPVALLKELDAQIKTAEIMAASDGDRSAAICCPTGAI